MASCSAEEIEHAWNVPTKSIPIRMARRTCPNMCSSGVVTEVLPKRPSRRPIVVSVGWAAWRVN